MFILALNSLSLTPGTKPSDFPLVLFLPGLAYRDQVLKENAPHFILAHSIPKKKKKKKDPKPTEGCLATQPNFTAREQMFPSPSLGMWRDFIYCSRPFINCQDQGEWMDSVRGTWGYKTTGKSCWCFSKHLEPQRGTAQFQGITSQGHHSPIVWTHSENISLNGADSGPSLKPSSAFPLISVCSGSGAPAQPQCEPRFSSHNPTTPRLCRAPVGCSLAPGFGETPISSWLCSAPLDLVQPSPSLPDLGGICKKKGDVRKRNSGVLSFPRQVRGWELPAAPASFPEQMSAPCSIRPLPL